MNTTREPTDLSSFDILNMFRARLYLSQTHLIAEAVTAIKDNTGLLSWIEFPPRFHSHLIKVALACIGVTPLTPAPQAALFGINRGLTDLFSL